MVYITGDTHGELERFQKGLPRGMKEGDTLIILGDFGFVWDNSAEEHKRLTWLASQPYKILFLDGCHENYTLLKEYTVEEHLSFRVRAIEKNIYHVCRGSVMELEGKKYLFFGGSESIDKEERETGVNWWGEELPNDEEKAYCKRNLEMNGNRVDIVLTHDAPTRFLDFTNMKRGESNRVQEYLDTLLDVVSYEKWLFGCYHTDIALSAKTQCVFQEVVAVNALFGEKPKKKASILSFWTRRR